MNTQEKILSTTMFKLCLYKKKGNAFQDFFVEIMTKFDKNFTPVKPQGRYGDRKNDGFIPSKGIYYQVYSPEDPDSKIASAVKKCREDFSKLKTFWHKKNPIKEFYFVFNEEYRGAFPTVLSEIEEIRKDNSDIKVDIFICKDLENIFHKLTPDQQSLVLNYIPEPDKIDLIDYESLTEVVNFLLEKQKPIDVSNGLKVPDFEEKIKINNLSGFISSLLVSASQQVSTLEEYFNANSDFSRQKLQNKFIDLYNNAQSLIKEDLANRSDLVFLHILKSASPKEEKHIEDAVLVLMSYFFETCDIFEEPK